MSIAVGILADAHNLFVAERVRGIPHRCMKIVARQAGIGFEQVRFGRTIGQLAQQ